MPAWDHTRKQASLELGTGAAGMACRMRSNGFAFPFFPNRSPGALCERSRGCGRGGRKGLRAHKQDFSRRINRATLCIYTARATSPGKISPPGSCQGRLGRRQRVLSDRSCLVYLPANSPPEKLVGVPIRPKLPGDNSPGRGMSGIDADWFRSRHCHPDTGPRPGGVPRGQCIACGRPPSPPLCHPHYPPPPEPAIPSYGVAPGTKPRCRRGDPDSLPPISSQQFPNIQNSN